MTENSSRLAYGISAAAGMVLWFATAMISGKREPWDSSTYWTVAYPVAIVLSGVLGYVFPRQPWRWAVVIMLMQIGVMIIGGSGFGLLPLGVILLGVLSLPAVATARFAARIRLSGGMSDGREGKNP
jgi:hypothetical protein